MIRKMKHGQKKSAILKKFMMRGTIRHSVRINSKHLVINHLKTQPATPTTCGEKVVYSPQNIVAYAENKCYYGVK